MNSEMNKPDTCLRKITGQGEQRAPRLSGHNEGKIEGGGVGASSLKMSLLGYDLDLHYLP